MGNVSSTSSRVEESEDDEQYLKLSFDVSSYDKDWIDEPDLPKTKSIAVKSLWIPQSWMPNNLLTKPIITTDGKILAFLDSYISPGLWSFDYKCNEWAQILQTSTEQQPIYVKFDLDSRYLYQFFRDHTLKMDLNHNFKTEKLEPLHLDTWSNTSVNIIDNQYHIITIGPSSDECWWYLIRNESEPKKKITAHYTRLGQSHDTVYIQGQKKLWLIGQGIIRECPKMRDITPNKIYHYYNRTAVKTLDGRYLIIFVTDNNNPFWDMSIMDITEYGLQKELRLRNCDIIGSKCPVRGNDIYAVSVDENKYELISGLIRKWIMIDNVPMEVINLIGIWFTNEYIHVFDKPTKSHWKIAVKDLLDLRI